MPPWPFMKTRVALLALCLVAVTIGGVLLRRDRTVGAVEEDVLIAEALDETLIVNSYVDAIAGIDGAGMDAAGTVWLLDALNRQVHVIRTPGEIAATWGRRGAGPGEFEDPSGIAVADDGEIVAVVDEDLRRLTVWTPDGEILYEVPIQGVILMVGVDGQRRVYVKSQSSDVLSVVRYSLDGEEEEIISLPLDIGAELEGRVPRGSASCTTCPFAVANDGRVALATNGPNFAVVVIDPKDDERKLIERHVHLVPYSEMETERIRRNFAMMGRDGDALIERRGPTKPPISQLAFDEQGSLWVQRRLEGNQSVVDVFSVDRSYMGSLMIRAAGVQMLDVGRRGILARGFSGVNDSEPILPQVVLLTPLPSPQELRPE